MPMSWFQDFCSFTGWAQRRRKGLAPAPLAVAAGVAGTLLDARGMYKSTAMGLVLRSAIAVASVAFPYFYRRF